MVKYCLISIFKELASRIKENEQKKEGANYRYPNSLILLLVSLHTYLLPYRQLEGFLRMMSVLIERLKKIVLYYTTIWWRVVRTKNEDHIGYVMKECRCHTCFANYSISDLLSILVWLKEEDLKSVYWIIVLLFFLT